MRPSLRTRLIAIAAVMLGLVAGLALTAWLIARDEIGRLRKIEASSREPVPPMLAAAISVAEHPSASSFQLARFVAPRRRPLEHQIEVSVTTFIAGRIFTSDDLLRMYAHQVYLGHGLYGVKAASDGYFGKTPARLSAAESALLAGMIRRPPYYSPIRNPERARERRDQVLRAMFERGVIDRKELTAALAEPLASPRMPPALP